MQKPSKEVEGQFKAHFTCHEGLAILLNDAIFKLKISHDATAANGKEATARCQHISQLKTSAFSVWQNKLWWFKTQQLILGTGTAIWWVTEPHLRR